MRHAAFYLHNLCDDCLFGLGSDGFCLLLLEDCQRLLIRLLPVLHHGFSVGKMTVACIANQGDALVPTFLFQIVFLHRGSSYYEVGFGVHGFLIHRLLQ